MSDRGDLAAELKLGDLLKTARVRKGLTLKEVSEDPEVGVSAAFLSRVERNDALPSDELLLKLARRLEVDASEALLRLFRDRASPEARRFVPLPSELRRAEATAEAAETVPGLEAIAEPLSQALAVHRNLLVENARLRQDVLQLSREVGRLGQEVAEEKRGFLPDVNHFLVSLFNYDCEVVRRDAVVSRTGDATITVTLEGITPKKGARPIRNLAHSVYMPQPIDGSLNISGQPTPFEVLEKPADLEMEYSFRRESPERGAYHVNFPNGFVWTPGSPRLSYRFSYRLEKAFVMTLEEAKATYGRRTIHDSPFEWSACFINKPVRRLEISVTFPEGYTPRYVDKWVWWTEQSFLESDHNLADRLLADPEDGIQIEEGEHTTVRLSACNPLLGFSYGIVWQPLAKREFLALLRG